MKATQKKAEREMERVMRRFENYGWACVSSQNLEMVLESLIDAGLLYSYHRLYAGVWRIDVTF